MADSTTRAVGYIRAAVATDSYTRHSAEIQAQRICQYCHINNIALVGTFADAGVNGSTTARNGLQRALSSLRQGQAQLLIVTHTSRLSRFIVALAALVEGHFAGGARALVSMDEQLDTRTDSGRFLFRVLCLNSGRSRR